jgi:hypothetical protein
MELRLDWLQPFNLLDGFRDNLIYGVDGCDQMPAVPGIYVFAHNHGDVIAPLYIGRALNLSVRISQQLNNLRLMNGLHRAPSGYRILCIAELETRRGQQVDRALAVVESALINAALADGYELLNIQGTNSLVQTITSRGNREARRWLQREIHLRRGT